MALVYDEKHPFSLDYEFDIPIKYKGTYVNRLTDFVDENTDYDTINAATRLKFLTNLKLVLLFAKFKKIQLVPRSSFNENEQNVINETAHYFNTLEMTRVPMLKLNPLEGNYTVILKSTIDWKKTMINPMSLVENSYSGTPTHEYYLGEVANDKFVLVSKTGKSLILVGDTTEEDCKNMLIK
jgi:hypothetical protein